MSPSIEGWKLPFSPAGDSKASGLDIDWIGPDSVRRARPGLNREGLLGGTFSPGDGFASPLAASTAFHKLAMDAGVDFFFGDSGSTPSR
jgi:sarcosine oxidase subunit beta